MLSTHPRFDARLIKIPPIGNYTHAIIRCPRCGGNIGITDAMLAGFDSIICKAKLNAGVCNGHYYWRGNQLEFVGTVIG
jgi:hypothetical protein